MTESGWHGRLEVLSLHGGGYLGLATAAFIEEAERHFCSRASDRFDLFCGTSTGAILALGFAAGRTGAQLVALYRELGPSVFPPGKRPNLLTRMRRSAYDSGPLRAALEREFEDLTLADLLASNKRVLVPAFCLSNGTPRIFKTDHATALSAHGGYRVVDVALASAAAPTYLPVHVVADPTTSEMEAFCDGGVFANDPSLIGYTEAIGYLGCDPADVALLSISTPRAFLGQWSIPRKLNGGYVAWGQQIPAVTIDGTAEVSHHILTHLAKSAGAIYEPFRLRNQARSGPAVDGLDDASESATKVLVQIGSQAARDQKARERLRPFFEDKKV